jgi:hypothetical protein
MCSDPCHGGERLESPLSNPPQWRPHLSEFRGPGEGDLHQVP